MSISAIARSMGVARNTVKLWIAREEESGDMQNLPRSGWPRKTTVAEDDRIMDYVKTHPLTNAVDAKAQLRLDNVSAQTVRWWWHDAGIHHRTPAVKEALQSRHIEGRLRFAQEYIGRDLSFCGRVSMTDEKHFHRLIMANSTAGDQQHSVWTPKHIRSSQKRSCYCQHVGLDKLKLRERIDGNRWEVLKVDTPGL